MAAQHVHRIERRSGVTSWKAIAGEPLADRQARIEGRAEVADRELAEELFAARPRSHQLQAHVSRQGEVIDDPCTVRTRPEALDAELADRPVPCPADWGAVRITPDVIEFWTEGVDRPA